MRTPLLVGLALVGCSDRRDGRSPAGPDWDPPPAAVPVVDDIGVSSGVQGGTPFGHFTRGRSCSVADVDLDGRQDLVLGNPGDVSYVLANHSTGPGDVRFELLTVLLEPEQYETNSNVVWAIQPADYDNDGDLDLFAAMGGIEMRELNRLFRNELVPTGQATFTEVAEAAGVLGPLNLRGEPQPAGNAGAQWGDVDLDGWVDLYVGEDVVPMSVLDDLQPTDWVGYDVLYLNNRDGTFRDVSKRARLSTQEPTRHPQLFDMDNDGDLDLYENNMSASNHIWMNRLQEDGVVEFLDVTDASSIEGKDLHYPTNSFAAATADLNNDGWDDVIAFVRGPPAGGPFTLGHVVLLNLEGRGFVDATEVSELNNPFDDGYRDHQSNGVMGCSPTDVNADGLPDIYIGNGGPEMGWPDQLFVARELVDHEFPGLGTLKVPVYDNWTELVDFPAEEDPEATALGVEYPPYPYRTHAVCVADFDLDGVVEIVVQNGGTLQWGGEVAREPNRVFQVHLPEPNHWLAVHPVGDGLGVSRDAIGARVHAVLETPDGGARDVYQTLRGGNAFSAGNGFDVHLGLGDAVAVTRLEVRWPDGYLTVLEDVAIDQRLEVVR